MNVSYEQAEKLSRECQKHNGQNEQQPGVNTQVVVESNVVLRISVEVTTAQKMDQVAKHPQKCRQPKQKQILHSQTTNRTLSLAEQCSMIRMVILSSQLTRDYIVTS